MHQSYFTLVSFDLKIFLIWVESSVVYEVRIELFEHNQLNIVNISQDVNDTQTLQLFFYLHEDKNREPQLSCNRQNINFWISVMRVELFMAHTLQDNISLCCYFFQCSLELNLNKFLIVYCFEITVAKTIKSLKQHKDLFYLICSFLYFQLIFLFQFD